MIGTHNSATGEKCKGLVSWLVYIFSKTQTKTIKEQFKAGCRYFDLRARYINGQIQMAHGLFVIDKTLKQVLDELNDLAKNSETPVYVSITYEGTNTNVDEWRNKIVGMLIEYSNLQLTSVNIKKPVWQCVYTAASVPTEQGFISLDMSTWHSLIPIPWLWDKLYKEKKVYNNDYFTLVDFL